MRILQTAHSYPPEVSGVAEVVRQVSERLASRGHEVHVATTWDRRAPRGERCGGVQVHRFSLEGNGVRGIRGDADAYLQFVLAGQWDVAVTHCAQTPTTDILLPHLDRLHGGRVFVGHGFSALQDPAYRDYFEQLAGWLSGMERIAGLSTMLEEPAFCARHGLPEPAIIPNGVDTREWNAGPLGVRQLWSLQSRAWLLSVSNHSPVKGHPTFFEVARRVREHEPEAVATIIGGSYPAARWRLGHLGIQGGCWYRCRVAVAAGAPVELRVAVPRHFVVSAVQEADVVLVTSSREASPLVIVESMAAGTPWVSFDVGCVREHAGGIVVNSPTEMVAAVRELLKNPETRRRLGAEGRARAASAHDWERITDKYEDLFTQALMARRN